jgi:hypothetical protein
MLLRMNLCLLCLLLLLLLRLCLLLNASCGD